MLSIALVTTLSVIVVRLLVNSYADRLCHPRSVFYWLFAYHSFFFLVYYLYALSTTSDSLQYYYATSNLLRGPNWLDFYGNGTIFIEFVAFPFVHHLGFSYEAMMLLFSLFGYIGFFYFYLFTTEFIRCKHKFFGIDFLLLLLFLPNMHFWTVSFGKGSLIFMGLGLLFYSLRNISSRLVLAIIGSLLVYHIRAHIFLIALIALLLGIFTSSRGLSIVQKVFLITVSILAISPALSTFLSYAQLDELSSESASSFLEHRVGDLSRATSGVNLNNYNQVQKILSFLFRPLFVDAPNALGLFVSVENLFYVFIFIKTLSGSFLRFLWNAHWIIKVAVLFFIGSTFALAQVSGNLGLAIRQKSQVMYLFFFVLLAYADHEYRTRGKLVIGE